MDLFTGGGELCPGGLSVWGALSGGLCPGGSLSRGGLCLEGGLYPGGLCQEDPLPPYGKEQAVRILLECILV